jgi:hypothetical protein
LAHNREEIAQLKMERCERCIGPLFYIAVYSYAAFVLMDDI